MLVIGYLYDISKQLGEPIEYSEFYNDGVNKYFDPTLDFFAWREGEGYVSFCNSPTSCCASPSNACTRFSFCNYSYILDPKSKSDILFRESKVTMIQLQREAIHNRLFGGPLSSFYLTVRVRRDHIIRDFLLVLSHCNPEDMKKVMFLASLGVAFQFTCTGTESEICW